MAGPVAQVLFATAVAASWQATLDEMIVSVSRGHREEDRFWVTTTRPIGGSYEGESRPFVVSVGTELPWEEDGLLGEAGGAAALYERPFGLCPDNGVTLIAMCNQPEDHRVLGELSLALAERLGGIIDMDGLIVPRAVPYAVWRDAPWSAVRPDVEAFTAAMPGKAVAIPYQTWGGEEWATHTVDTAFLRAWLRHPEFRMIK